MNDRGDAGWYPDPYRRFEYRYFNGQRWTNDVAANGRRLIDSGEAMSLPPTHLAWQGGPFETPGRGMAVASFVLAVAAVLIGWVPYVFVLAAAAVILAVVFGTIGLRRAHERSGAGRGFATAGLILSGVAACVCVGGFFFTTWLQRQIERYDDPGEHTVEEGRCDVTDGTVSFSGTITNLESGTRSYELTLTFATGGRAERARRVDVDGVAAGATAAWATTEQLDAATVSCSVAKVHGPSPLGIRTN